MPVFLPPTPFENTEKKLTVFLAGSIDMGTANRWQDKVVEFLKKFDINVLNPRRDDWDLTTPQQAENKEFRAQVEWELQGLRVADVIVMYFDRDSKSPISFLEFGLFARTHKMIVHCPEGFWRKGNIDIECEKFNIPHFSTEPEFFSYLQKTIEEKISHTGTNPQTTTI